MGKSKVIDRDRGWNRIKKEIKLMNRGVVKIGILSDAGIHRGGKKKRQNSSQVNYVDIAMINEFGSPRRNIPSRPFMRMAFEKNNRKLTRLTKKLMNQIYDGTISTRTALKKLGLAHQDQVQSTIEGGGFAANEPSTRARKGSTQPLIDSGLLKNKISFEIEGV